LIYPATDMTTKTESRQMFGRGFYLTDEFMDVAKGHYLTGHVALGRSRCEPVAR
jgi:acetyl esterase